MKRITFTAALMAALTTTGALQATDVHWEGGVGFWDLGPWNNGTIVGTSQQVLGRDDGWYNSATPITADPDIIIGAGDSVLHDGDFIGDFRMDAGGGGQTPAFGDGGSLTVRDGGHLNMQSAGASDGIWSQFDSDYVTITGAGSLLERTVAPGAEATTFNAGNFGFGSWRGYDNQEMELNILDHGRLENDGQLLFGAAGDNVVGLTVRMTVGTGASADLTNGGADSGSVGGLGNDDSACFDGNTIEGPCQGEFNFVYGYDGGSSSFKGEDYSINFTGHGGSITVDHAGIWLQEETGAESLNGLLDDDGNPVTAAHYVATQVTYQQLYDGVTNANPDDPGNDLATKQILRANGSNALPFGDNFAVSGTTGNNADGSNGTQDDNYKVTMIREAGSDGTNVGDISGDGAVNAVDAGILAANWGTGTVIAEGDIASGTGTDPYPFDDTVNAVDAGALFAAWTGDPGPVAPGEASAEYNHETGRILVSGDGLINWYIDSASGGLTGEEPNFPNADNGLRSNNDNQIGETDFGGLGSFENFDLGQVAALDLPEGDLTIVFLNALGGQEQRALLSRVPEPTSAMLAMLGLGCALAARRRLFVS